MNREGLSSQNSDDMGEKWAQQVTDEAPEVVENDVYEPEAVTDPEERAFLQNFGQSILEKIDRLEMEAADGETEANLNDIDGEIDYED